ncbi:serine/threonine-protein kinase [Streptomyces liliifuscus]|uniref:non-specific serine/threonine protein kinase n=1 Tax=Streptomyces liliifuscus TaxID=2797636 RepID=A0A7T7KU40_9ACTN|nr:serine/threonine-protein kinase [Streptomyces liliifuscus]QQM38825.1 serine/threonine protein kinase [Streptomyces liliifuscus]
MSEGDSDRRVIDGRFRLESRLGGGGMGTVWRATDLVLHRSVAVKEVRPPDAGVAEYDPDGARMLRERVLREARALARIDHPNVVTIHHIVDGGEGTYPWIVMELVGGGSLADRLGRGPMDPAETARLGREVLAALRAAHDAGIQHRDVKPANLLLRPDGRPVLTDFGIAAIRESTALTATGSIIGTADYMAPERVSGNDGGAASDLWSLAMMLYAAVEGRHPLRRGTTLATLAAVLYEEVPPPVKAGPLADVLMRVLVRDPAARPDAESLDRMLASVAEGEQAVASGGSSGTTSYRLTPPSAAPPFPSGSGESGPPTGYPTPQDAVPRLPAAPTPYPMAPAGAPTPARPSRQRRWSRVVLSAAATALVGVLVWTLVPDGGKSGSSSSEGAGNGAGAKPSRSGTPTTESSADASTPTPRQTEKGSTTDLLTPDGIRTAIKAFKKETGSDLFGDFKVYPEHISAYVMVKGSRTRYDTYTYRVDRGLEKGIIKGSLSGGAQVFNPDDFDWDTVPGLLAEARKKLNVDSPTSRYLLVEGPNELRDTPADMAVYLSNEYNESGYLEADIHGKVTKVMAADG